MDYDEVTVVCSFLLSGGGGGGIKGSPGKLTSARTRKEKYFETRKKDRFVFE